MSNFLKDFEEAFDDFLGTTVYFNESKICYKFQGVWTSNMYNTIFEEKANRLMLLLRIQLKNGLNNKSFLTEIQRKLRDTSNFLYDIYYDDFDNLEKSNLKIKRIFEEPESSDDNVFNYDFYEKKLYIDIKEKSSKNKENEISNSLIDFFENYQIKNNSAPSKLQFENYKLLDCIYYYQEIVFETLTEVDYYLINFDVIDFTKIDIEEHQPIVSAIEKCKINLSKIEVARFFKFLMVEQIIYFDLIDGKKNKIKLQNFIQDHFTYKSLNTKQENITNLQREFAETHIEIKEDYNKLIDELIAILNSKRKI